MEELTNIIDSADTVIVSDAATFAEAVSKVDWADVAKKAGKGAAIVGGVVVIFYGGKKLVNALTPVGKKIGRGFNAAFRAFKSEMKTEIEYKVSADPNKVIQEEPAVVEK